ncbi:MAG: hypothetical protein V4534_05075 [Myxococcota bacterium]
MIGYSIAFATYLVLVFLIRRSLDVQESNPIVLTLSVGYWLRIVLSFFLRDIPFWSHGAGGDYAGYEYNAQDILIYWHQHGLEYVTRDKLPTILESSLPANIIALMSYLNGGYSRVAVEGLIAFCACMTCLMLYQLYIIYDPIRKISFRMMLFCLFGLTFLFYTSDLFKDAYVVFFVVGIFWASLRFIQAQSVLPGILFCLCCFVGLWNVRHYMVYPVMPIFTLGILGISFTDGKSRAVWVMTVMAVGVSLMPMLYDLLHENAEKTFEIASSEAWHRGLQEGGSGVDLGEYQSSVFSWPIKVIYTLFAPFPWQGGSLGFQIAKVELLVWYYCYYQAFAGLLFLNRRNRYFALAFLVFLVPAIFAYAVSFGNIGLIVRQRLPIMFVVSILAVWGMAQKPREIS